MDRLRKTSHILLSPSTGSSCMSTAMLWVQTKLAGGKYPLPFECVLKLHMHEVQFLTGRTSELRS